MILSNLKKGMIFPAVLYICLGLFMVLFPSTTSVILCYVLGGVPAVCGIVKLVQHFTSKEHSFFFQFDLILGMFTLVLSGLFLWQPMTIQMAVPIIMGILLLADCIIKFQLALELKRVQYGRWWVNLVMALICAVFSILLITNPFASGAALMLMAGICFILDGLLDLWSLLYVSRAIKNTRTGAKT